MRIALTKKLATAMGVKVASADDNDAPLFSWTANWTNTFDGRKEDMVVMVNHATRFTVVIYGVKWNQFKSIAMKMSTAIRNTLAAMNLNQVIIDEYMQRAGEIEFVSNNDRKKTAWVNRQGLEAAFHVGRAINESEGRIKFDDAIGHIVSKNLVNYSNSSDEGYYPAEKMIKALVELTSKPAYKYRAFELLVTLDLEIYKATRRLIVAADMEFTNLHRVLQSVFKWENYHLHDFKVLDVKSKKPVRRLVMSEEDQFYDKEAILETGHKLSDYFPKYRQIIYTYDFGDNWNHLIEFVSELEEHDAETPYLLEAKGKAPPEDVGGIHGYMDFREAMLDPSHPNHAATKEWAGFWSPELRDWEKRPGVVRY
jgi:hypothetical protein